MGCKTCNSSGYVPFTKPNGLVSHHAQVVCPACGGYDHEVSYADANMPDRIPSDFDFACSDTWRGFYQGENNIQKMHSVQPHKVDTLDDRRWDRVQQLRAQVVWLSKKVTEKRAKKSNDNYEPF